MRAILLLLVVFIPLTGCVKRTLSIESTPKGALVWVNDREVGRTPLQVDFVYYGEYDVRLEKDGFEPIMTTRLATAPLWDAPVIDIFSGIATRLESRIEWVFTLEPRDDDPTKLVNRATTLRNSLLENSK